VDYIDFYHLHGLDEDRFRNVILKYDLLKEAQKAKEEGLIKHSSFSFHDKPEVMKRIIDLGVFESVLCQYNLLDRSNEEAMAYARKKGLGVAVMGPIGGGRLAASGILNKILTSGVKSTPELALRFVLANKNVSVALSGMGSMEMVEENVKVASSSQPLTSEELQVIENFLEERREKEEIPCNMCKYCQPCPSNIPIPAILLLMNYYTVYGLREFARKIYGQIGAGKEVFITPDLAFGSEACQADACTECGECEEKCPQKIKIMDKLKECHQALG